MFVMGVGGCVGCGCCVYGGFCVDFFLVVVDFGFGWVVCVGLVCCVVLCCGVGGCFWYWLVGFWFVVVVY